MTFARSLARFERAETEAAAGTLPSKAHGSAAAWSVIPRLGQIYAGEYRNGTIRVTISVGVGAIVLVRVVIANQHQADRN